MDSTAISNSTSPREVAESRVIRIAGYLRMGTWILLTVTILLTLCAVAILFWSPTLQNGSRLLEGLLSEEGAGFQFRFEKDGISIQLKWLIAGYFALIGLFYTYCFTRLHILFNNFRNKLIFIKRNSTLLRSLGYALVVGIFLGGFLKFGLLAAIGLLNTTGQSFGNLPNLSLTFGTSEIKSLVAVGLLFLTAWILEIGRDLYSEAELTI